MTFYITDMLTKSSDVTYGPNAKSPKWLASIDKAFHSNEELKWYYQKVVGYTMTYWYGLEHICTLNQFMHDAIAYFCDMEKDLI